MTNQMVIAVSIKLIAGFIAALISVLLWSKTRDGAWLTMVIGVVFLYLQKLLEILDAFGFDMYKEIKYGEIEIIPLLFETLPFLFFGLGMFLFLLRIRKF